MWFKSALLFLCHFTHLMVEEALFLHLVSKWQKYLKQILCVRHCARHGGIHDQGVVSFLDSLSLIWETQQTQQNMVKVHQERGTSQPIMRNQDQPQNPIVFPPRPQIPEILWWGVHLKGFLWDLDWSSYNGKSMNSGTRPTWVWVLAPSLN